MKGTEFMESARWVESRLEVNSAEIRARGIQVHCEFDPAFHLPGSVANDRALDALLRFAFATVPDGCEVYLASSRMLAPVAPLGAGSLTSRWQVAGAAPPPTEEGSVRALHPVVGEASAHLASFSARQVRDAFRSAGWQVELSTLEEGREILVRAELPGQRGIDETPGHGK